MPEALAIRLASIDPLISAPDISMLSKSSGKDLQSVARIYFAAGESFGFDWLRTMASEMNVDNRWQQSAMTALIDDLYLTGIKAHSYVLHKSGIVLESV